MMSSPNRVPTMQTKHREKSVWSFVIVAALALLAGAIAAGVVLATQNVPESSASSADKHQGVVFIRGSSNASPGAQAAAQAISSGVPGLYSLTEGDVNSLLRTYWKPAAGDSAPLVRLTETPNLRIDAQGNVYLALRLSIPMISADTVFLYQVRGHMAPGGFRADMGWIGQCPVPLLNNLVIGMVRSGFENGPEGANLKSIEGRISFSVDGGMLFVKVK
jgi:hypothetical protein